MVRPSVQRPPTTQYYMDIIVNEIDILKNEFNKDKSDRNKDKIDIAIQNIKTNLTDRGLMLVAQYQPSHYDALKTKATELLSKKKNLHKNHEYYQNK